jgi:hypothetical protein
MENSTHLTEKPFLSLTMAERREYIRGLMLDGSYPNDESMSVRKIVDNGMECREVERDYYRFRIQLENIDPAVSAPEIKTNQARFFLEAYGLERASPFLSSYTWICACSNLRNKSSASPQTTQHIKMILVKRGADKVCEEVRNRTPEQIKRMNFSALWGQNFIEIFGLKALNGLPPEMASRFKARHLESAMGL